MVPGGKWGRAELTRLSSHWWLRPLLSCPWHLSSSSGCSVFSQLTRSLLPRFIAPCDNDLPLSRSFNITLLPFIGRCIVTSLDQFGRALPLANFFSPTLASFFSQSFLFSVFFFLLSRSEDYFIILSFYPNGFVLFLFIDSRLGTCYRLLPFLWQPHMDHICSFLV